MSRKKESDSRADYFRKWRAGAKLVKDQEEREAHRFGVREGVELCIKHCKQVIGNHALTGHQMAGVLERAMIGAETPEAAKRRELVESLQATVR